MKIIWSFQSRARKDGRKNLQVRYRDGRNYVKEFNFGLFVFPEHFDKKQRLLNAIHPDAVILNERISEINERIDTAYNLAISGATRSAVERAINKKSLFTTLEDYIEYELIPQRNKTISDRQVENLLTWYGRFKNIINRKSPIKWNEINNDLYKKYYESYEPLLRDEKVSKRTYKNYASAPLTIFNRALEDEIIKMPKPIIKKTYKSPKARGKKKPNIAISTKEFIKVINSANTIERWEACAIWLLEFGLRGIGNSDLIRMTDEIVRSKDDRPVARSLKAWFENDLHFDYGRSKTGAPMFIKIFPQTLSLFEKLKYSLIYTHAGKEIDGKDIVVGLKDKYSLLKYDSKRSSKSHSQIFRNRSSLFKDLGFEHLDFASARITFMQTAKRTSNRNTSLVKALMGETNDKLLQDHYDNYKDPTEIEWINNEHKKVLDDFKYDMVVSYAINQLKKIIEETNAPKWILKQSGLHRQGNKFQVMVGFENRKIIWEDIPKKYAKYFLNDNPEDDYWEDIDEVLNKEPKDSIELIEWWDRVQNTSGKWISLAKQHQKVLDEQIKQDGKVVELNNRVS